MIEPRKFLPLVLISAFPLIGLAGCEQEGPFERAGEEADEVMDEVGEDLEEIGEEIDEAAEPD